MTATFEDLIQQSQPAFYDEGCLGYGTSGASWRWVLESPYQQEADWSGCTFVCEILDTDYATVLLTLSLTADVWNRLILTASPTVTATIDPAVPTNYPWRAYATKGTDRVILWVADASEFTVYPAAT